MKTNFRLHTGAWATVAQLHIARKAVASNYRANATLVLSDHFNYPYADHVSVEQIIVDSYKLRATADEIELGIHDSNFWCWQQLNYAITGKSIPLLNG